MVVVVAAAAVAVVMVVVHLSHGVEARYCLLPLEPSV
jgi:hypothetical protein